MGEVIRNFASSQDPLRSLKTIIITMKNLIIVVMIGVFHHTSGQGLFSTTRFNHATSALDIFYPYGPYACRCTDFTFDNGIETVGNCRTGEGYGFCYVHIPSRCPDRIRSEAFVNELEPEYSMHISHYACEIEADPFASDSQILLDVIESLA